MVSTNASVPPPFEDPPVLETENLKAWVVDGKGAYTWFSQAGRLLAADCEPLLERLSWPYLRARFEGERLSFFHDWSRCNGYESKARHLMMEWAMSIPKDHFKVSIIQLSPNTPTIVRMGVATGTAAVAVMGRRVKVAEEGADMVRDHNLKAVPY